jgi:hypothetical protein
LGEPIRDKKLGCILKRTACAEMGTWGRDIIRVCGGHRINKGRREVKYVGCRHAAEDQSKNSKRKMGKEGKPWG